MSANALERLLVNLPPLGKVKTLCMDRALVALAVLVAAEEEADEEAEVRNVFQCFHQGTGQTITEHLFQQGFLLFHHVLQQQITSDRLGQTSNGPQSFLAKWQIFFASP